MESTQSNQQPKGWRVIFLIVLGLFMAFILYQFLPPKKLTAFSTYFDIVNWISTLISLGGLVFAYRAYRKTQIIEAQNDTMRKRQDGRISIYLFDNMTKKKYRLPSDLRRSDLTRAELFGRIGAIPRKEPSDNYRIDHLLSRIFYDDLIKAQTNEGAYEIIIPCDDSEILQFDLEALNKLDTPKAK